MSAFKAVFMSTFKAGFLTDLGKSRGQLSPF